MLDCNCPDCTGVKTEENALEVCINGEMNAKHSQMKASMESPILKFIIFILVITFLLAAIQLFT